MQNVRILCINRRSILVEKNERGWTLPRGDVDSGETTEEAAARVLREKFDVRARVLRRVSPPAGVRGLVGDWLVVAETDMEPMIEGSYGFHEITPARPVGPLDTWLWGGLATLVASASYQSRWIGSHSATRVA